MKRREFLTRSAGAVALSGAALSPIRLMAQDAKGTVIFGQSTAILTLDPAHGAFTGYPGGYEAALVLFDRLLDFDTSMNIVPQIAESYAMSDDLQSCTLKLRVNVTFHDGTPCDAAAVKFNIERMMDKDLNPSNRPLWDPISGVEAPDTTTVVISMSKPFSDLPNTLAHGSGAIVSPAAIAANGEDGFAQNPIGAGPYMLDSFSPGQELVLKAYDGYWGGAPGARSLVFKNIAEPATRINALKTGAVTMIDAVPVQLVGQLTGSSDLQIIRKAGLRPIGLALNLRRAGLSDPKVRMALNMAVPVEVIAEKVFAGYAKAPDSPLAFDTNGHAVVGKTEFDQEKAKTLLAEAGYEVGSDGIAAKAGEALSFTMFAPEGLFPGDVAVAEIVAASLGQIGVAVEIRKVEKGAYWSELRKPFEELDWDMAMFGFNPSNASGAYHLNSLFRSNTDDNGQPDAWNICRYRNTEVDNFLSTSQTAAREEERNAALAEAQRLIWNDAPYLWLQINENIAATSASLSGAAVMPLGFTSLRDAAL